MRVLFAGLLLLVVVGTAPAAQLEKPGGGESARILALENIWNQAEIKHDGRALSILLGDDFTYTDIDGSFLSRSEWLAYVESESDEYDLLGNSKMRVRLYNNAAVVTGIYRERIKIGGKMVERTGRFTDTWMKQENEWKCVASQATLIIH